MHRFALACVVLFLQWTWGSPPNFKSIDRKAIQKAYSESDWDLVKLRLEGYLREKGDGNVSREERIFAYKYLGVIYAADTLTAARAESYFHRLLDLSPDIEIVDMFASKRVNDLFLGVKNEQRRRLAYQEKHDEYGNVIVMDTLGKSQSSAPKALPRPNRVKSRKNTDPTWIWWTAGATLVMGAVIGIYFLTDQDDPKTTVTTTDVDGTLQASGGGP